MIQEAASGRWWRATVALLALAASVLVIAQLFSSGFGRTAAPALVQPRLVPLTIAPTAPTVPAPSPSPTIAVVSDDLWLTYLPGGLERIDGGPVEPASGVHGGRVLFGSGDRSVEVQVERGTFGWDAFRARNAVLDARPVIVRGKPAVVGRHPGGGRLIVWLERLGTGAWIRVSESLAAELLTIALSAKSPVRD
ncbi:hypothetical protein [Nonomuraea soli]|uniref:Uncharacterized protein n=1 Tax=Nonomuraea soli TaxID=1032476 RepID=A0A7W0CTW5_9ACTN|nr:hypothetical protein [Nonomuraea soli]MBA2897123.1 hypothetical protein [Nonomuraea soli]